MDILSATSEVIFASKHKDIRQALEEAVSNGANLTLAKLVGAYCNQAALQGAKLCDANLTYAILRSSKLTDANLSGAKLYGADLTNAELSNVDLSHTDLYNTNLSGATLRGANLKNAICNGTIFSDTDLSSVSGLKDIQHRGPSSLATSVLYNSHGKIPDIFLRGCGVPEELIKYLPSLINSAEAIDFYSCFISYSHENKAFAQRLHDQLQSKGIRCWLDSHELLPGDNIYKEIDRGIRVWDKLLLCSSEESLTSGWVDDELKHAFAKEKQLYKERKKEVLAVVPLDLDGYIFSEWEHPKKNQLMERLIVSFKGWETDNSIFEQEFERIVQGLRADDFARQPPPEPKL